MDAEHAELLQTSPLIQRLDRRRTESIGLINLNRYRTESSAVPSWIVQRSTLLDQLQTRYSSSDRDAAGASELPLAMASPVPNSEPERVSRSPLPIGAIATSTPIAAKPSLPLATLPTDAAPVAQSNVPLTPAPESIAPMSESIAESVPAAVQPVEQYRIRRISANPTSSATIIQRAIDGTDSARTATPPADTQSAADSTADPTLTSTVAAASPQDVSAPNFTNTAPPDRSPSEPNATLSSPEALSTPAIQFEPPPTADLLVLRKADSPNSLPATSESTATPDTQASGGDRDPPPSKLSTPEGAIASVQPTANAIALPIVQRSADSAIASVQSTPETIALPVVQSSSPAPMVARSIDPIGSQPISREVSSQTPGIAPVSISEVPLQPSLIWRSSSEAANGVPRSIQPELPLAVSSVAPAPVAIARLPDAPSTSGSTASSSPNFEPPPASALRINDVNVGQLAEQVSRILFRQLTVERERRGMGKWS